MFAGTSPGSDYRPLGDYFNGPRATPVWDDGRIYALGAQGELLALDLLEIPAEQVAEHHALGALDLAGG